MIPCMAVNTVCTTELIELIVVVTNVLIVSHFVCQPSTCASSHPVTNALNAPRIV